MMQKKETRPKGKPFGLFLGSNIFLKGSNIFGSNILQKQ